MSFARNFALGQQVGKGLVDTYDTARQNKEFGDIQNATREDSRDYSEADLNRLRQFALDKNKDGTARYTMEGGADGGFNARANTAYQGDDGLPVPQGMAMGIQPQRMATFLGQRYNADELSPERMEGLRSRAMASAVGKTDPIRGMALQQQIKAGERDDQRFVNEQITFGLTKSRGERQDRRDAQIESDEKTDRDVETKTGEFLASRAKNADGSPRALTMDDHTGALQHKASLLLENGRVNAAGAVMKDFAQQAVTMITLQTAQRGEAIKVAAGQLAAGNLQGVADFYNKFVPDGARVTGITQNKDGSIAINRTALDGKPSAPTVLKSRDELLNGLMSFQDPMRLYEFSQTEFKNGLELRKVRATETQARASASSASDLASVRAEQVLDIKDARKNREAAAEFAKQYYALTPEDQAGSKGRGLQASYNMANAKVNGGQVTLGRPAQPPISNSELLNYVKENGSAPTSVKDPAKPGKFLSLSQVPPAQQRAEAEKFFGSPGQPAVEYKAVPAPPRAGATPLPAPAVDTPGPAGGLRRPMNDTSAPIVQRAKAQLDELDKGIAQAEQVIQAVIRSGDAQSISRYGAALNDLRSQRASVLNSVGPMERAYLE